MGNPHAVIRVEDVDAAPVAEVGPRMEYFSAFPARVNVGFLQVVSRTRGKLRVWERGAGETLACGTGACAVTAAAVWQGYCRYDENVEVRQPGGILTTAYLADGRMLMEGPTEYVFEGYFDIPIASFYNGTR